jgi:hypothetical protein
MNKAKEAPDKIKECDKFRRELFKDGIPAEQVNDLSIAWERGFDAHAALQDQEVEKFAIDFLIDVVIKYGMEYTISGWHQPRGKNPKTYYTNKELMEFYKRDLKLLLNPPLNTDI